MKIIVVGGGPGGYVAALKAAIMGAETVLIEKDSLGGTCLNRGCIPTKALLSSVEIKHDIDMSDVFGISCGEAEADFEKICQRKQAIVARLVGGVGFLCKKRGVKVIKGEGCLSGPKTVNVTGEDGSVTTVEGDAVILATGSVPVVPGFLPYDGETVITSDELLNLDKIPDDLLIIGGGVIGCEFGYFYSSMGSNVTIVEMQPHILPNEDKDVSEILTEKLKKSGINIITGESVKSVDVKDNRAVVKVSTGEVFNVDKVLVSIGRKAVTENLGLEEVGIEIEKGKVVVDEKMKTSIDSVYAIGDMVNTPALAHVASREGIVAVENIMGKDVEAEYHAVPRCVYTSPEVACVGLTEEGCRERGIGYYKGKFGFSSLGKAMVINDNTGFVKIIVDENYVVIGAAIVGPHATDMITEIGVAVHKRLTIQQLQEVIHPHPTLAEAIMEAADDVTNESVHSY